jgi:hypothetical protein
MRELLEEGLKRSQSEDFSRDLLKLWPALWMFAEREGVEPTNPPEADRAGTQACRALAQGLLRRRE